MLENNKVVVDLLDELDLMLDEMASDKFRAKFIITRGTALQLKQFRETNGSIDCLFEGTEKDKEIVGMAAVKVAVKYKLPINWLNLEMREIDKDLVGKLYRINAYSFFNGMHVSARVISDLNLIAMYINENVETGNNCISDITSLLNRNIYYTAQTLREVIDRMYPNNNVNDKCLESIMIAAKFESSIRSEHLLAENLRRLGLDYTESSVRHLSRYLSKSLVRDVSKNNIYTSLVKHWECIMKVIHTDNYVSKILQAV